MTTRSMRLVLVSFCAAFGACADLETEADAPSADALGTGTGLHADYFNNQTLTAPAAVPAPMRR